MMLCLKLLSLFFHGEGDAGADAEFFRPGYSVTWPCSAAVESLFAVVNGVLTGGFDDTDRADRALGSPDVAWLSYG